MATRVFSNVSSDLKGIRSSLDYKHSQLINWLQLNVTSSEFISNFNPAHEPINFHLLTKIDYTNVLSFYIRKYPDLIDFSEHNFEALNGYIQNADLPLHLELAQEVSVESSKYIVKKELTISWLNVFIKYEKQLTQESMADLIDLYYAWRLNQSDLDRETIQLWNTLFSSPELSPFLSGDLDRIKSYKGNLVVEVSSKRQMHQSMLISHLEKTKKEELKFSCPDIFKIPLSNLDASGQKRWFSFIHDVNQCIFEQLGVKIKPMKELLEKNNTLSKISALGTPDLNFNFALFDVVKLVNDSKIEYDEQVLVNELSDVSGEVWNNLNDWAWGPDNLLVLSSLVEELSKYYKIGRIIKIITSCNDISFLKQEPRDTVNLLQEFSEIFAKNPTMRVVPDKPKNIQALHDFMAKLPKVIDAHRSMQQEWSEKLEGQKIDDYTIEFLKTDSDFVLVGAVLSHCVGGRSYRDKVYAKQSQIFILKDAEGDIKYCVEYTKQAHRRSHDLGLPIIVGRHRGDRPSHGNDAVWRLQQARGYSNAGMPTDLQVKMVELVSHHYPQVIDISQRKPVTLEEIQQIGRVPRAQEQTRLVQTKDLIYSLVAIMLIPISIVLIPMNTQVAKESQTSVDIKKVAAALGSMSYQTSLNIPEEMKDKVSDKNFFSVLGALVCFNAEFEYPVVFNKGLAKCEVYSDEKLILTQRCLYKFNASVKEILNKNSTATVTSSFMHCIPVDEAPAKLTIKIQGLKTTNPLQVSFDRGISL